MDRESTIERWRRAYEIAQLAMGKDRVRDGRKFKSVWRGDQDPLARHLLAELIYAESRP